MKPLFLLLALCFPSICHAQPGKVEIGIVGGPTHTNFSRKNNPFTHFVIESDIRKTAGITGKFRLSNTFFLSADLLYEYKGYRTDHINRNSDGSAEWSGYMDFHYHYLVLPVFIGVEVMQTGFFVKAGPYAASLLKQDHTFDGPEANKPTMPDGFYTGSWKKTDYGVSAGIGYAFPVGTSISVSAEVRHNESLRDISTGPFGFKSRSTAALFGISYKMGN